MRLLISSAFGVSSAMESNFASQRPRKSIKCGRHKDAATSASSIASVSSVRGAVDPMRPCKACRASNVNCKCVCSECTPHLSGRWAPHRQTKHGHHQYHFPSLICGKQALKKSTHFAFTAIYPTVEGGFPCSQCFGLSLRCLPNNWVIEEPVLEFVITTHNPKVRKDDCVLKKKKGGREANAKATAPPLRRPDFSPSPVFG